MELIFCGIVSCLIGIMVGWFASSNLLLDHHEERRQFKNEFQEVHEKLSQIVAILQSKIPEEKKTFDVLDRSGGRSGPKHRTMWGDV